MAQSIVYTTIVGQHQLGGSGGGGCRCSLVRIQVGFKGLHWAWLGISAINYLRMEKDRSIFAAKLCRGQEQLDPVQWLAFFAWYLEKFPWANIVHQPNHRWRIICHSDKKQEAYVTRVIVMIVS